MKKGFVCGILLCALSFPSTLPAQEREMKEIEKLMDRSAHYSTPEYPDFRIYDPFGKVPEATEASKKVEVKVAPPLPVVKGIIDDTAFIAGKWRREGEYVGTYKIVSVAESGVTVELGGHRFDIPLLRKRDDKHIIITDRKSIEERR